ncbi:carboxypeptidase regulatory-like domain-containing protein [Streptomyces sp. NPDC050504]|uniref:carboxypeptidase regulatory-like domain-containing protein n=1 Tax=Streptomyces sp. NPDC050504 TaxID=3365618 RepID=UPI00378ADFEA
MNAFVPLARSTLYSPVWLVPFDDHARRVRSAGVDVALDRHQEGEGWLPQDVRAVRTPSGAIAFPGLGRRAEPWNARPELHRARFAARGLLPLYPADGEPYAADLLGVEFLVHPYDDGHPPTVTVEPRLVRLLPSTAFPYAPGTRTVVGKVVDATRPGRPPVANALVEAVGSTSRDLADWHERTLTDARGAFRLSLRWEGEKATEDAADETFRLMATERPGRTGALVVKLPEDAGLQHVIEIREQ